MKEADAIKKYKNQKELLDIENKSAQYLKKKINREVVDKVKTISQEEEQTQMKVVDKIQQIPKS